MRGDHARASRLFEESLTIHRSLDDAWGVSHSLSNLAFLALEAGDAETARDLLSEALAIERESGHHAVARERARDVGEARRRGRAAGARYSAVRPRRAAPRDAGARLHYELGWPDPTPNLDDLRSRLGEETFEEEWARGRAMSLLEAIDQAIGEQRELKASTL